MYCQTKNIIYIKFLEIPVPTFEDEWTFDNPNSRERLTSAPRGQSEPFTTRIYQSNLRILDEIIHSGIDPRLKTKSDCVQDAVALFIEDWVKNYSDGLSGRTLQMLKLERIRMQREAREEFIRRVDEEIESAKYSQDRESLGTILYSLSQERGDSEGWSPNTYIAQLDVRIEDLRHILSDRIYGK